MRQISMMPKAAYGGFILASLLAVSACGASVTRSGAVQATLTGSAAVSSPGSSCAAGSAFALSLVSDRGGQPTPIAAATWFARHGGVPGVPAVGWRETGRTASGATVQSGSVTLHVLQGPDQTWQVDGGSRCA